MIAICEACARGEDGVTCFRDMPGTGGRCPVCDDGPELAEANDSAVDVFLDAQTSGEKVETKAKVLLYLRPTEIEASMRLLGVPEGDRPAVLRKVRLLEELSNDLRPRIKRRRR